MTVMNDEIKADEKKGGSDDGPTTRSALAQCLLPALNDPACLVNVGKRRHGQISLCYHHDFSLSDRFSPSNPAIELFVVARE